jgi:hypothetical protein
MITLLARTWKVYKVDSRIEKLSLGSVGPGLVGEGRGT